MPANPSPTWYASYTTSGQSLCLCKRLMCPWNLHPTFCRIQSVHTEPMYSLYIPKEYVVAELLGQSISPLQPTRYVR